MKPIKQLLAAILLSVVALTASAGAFTDFAENKLIDYLFRGQASGAPSTW